MLWSFGSSGVLEGAPVAGTGVTVPVGVVLSQAGHGPDAVQVVPDGPRLPPGAAGRGVGPLGQSARRAWPAPSTPDTCSVGTRLGVPPEHLLGVAPEHAVHDVGR